MGALLLLLLLSRFSQENKNSKEELGLGAERTGNDHGKVLTFELMLEGNSDQGAEMTEKMADRCNKTSLGPSPAMEGGGRGQDEMTVRP